MSSLLSPFNFGQKHAYFHAKITIHELVNVPLVSGHFKARWRVKNVHGLQNIPGTMSHSQHSSTDSPSQQQHHHHHQQQHHHHLHHEREVSAGTANIEEAGDRKSLNHRKSFNSIASQEKNISQSNSSSKDDLRDQSGQLQSTVERKSSHRFLAGFKEAFHNKSRRSTSNTQAQEEHQHVISPLAIGGDGGDSPAPESSQSSASREDLKLPRADGQLPAPKRQGSVKSIAAESDGSHKRTSMHSSKGHSEKEPHPSSAANQAALMIHAEPKGETSNEKVREHIIKWERQVEVGIRIAVEKQKLNDKTSSSTPTATASGALTPSGHGESGTLPSSSSALSNRSSYSAIKDGSLHGLRGQPSHKSLADRSDADSKIDRLEREAKEKDRDRELADAWGMLGSAELKIVIRGDIPTDTSGSTNAADSHVSIGHVVINLAEFAPFPESAAHQHHHHQHPQHHHNNPQHPHHHYHLHHHHMVLSRTETRRYLLSESRINATLKLTIEMTHMGGSREYAVPAVRRGLIVGGISSFVNGPEKVHNNRSGTNGSLESGNGSTEGHDKEIGRSGEGRSRSASHSASVASIVHNPISSWPDDSVAKHARIPASNLRTELSHEDAARAVREAGGHRSGFSFGAGAHHERPPEEVIESLFNPISVIAKRAEKANKLNRTRSKEGKMGVKAQDTFLMDGSKDGKLPTPVSPGGQGDLTMTPPSSSAMNLSTEERPTEVHKRGHKSTPSNSTMRSILTNSISSKASLHHLPTNPFHGHYHSSGTNSSDSPQLAGDISSISSSSDYKIAQTSSKGPSLVRWDASVDDGEGNKISSSTTPSSQSGPGKLLIPNNNQVTASPSLMSQRVSENISPIEPIQPPHLKDEPQRDSFTKLCTLVDEEEKIEKLKKKKVDIAPPSLPPDVARREANYALSHGIHHVERDTSHYGEDKSSTDSTASRGSRGLTKEEALEKGYRGIGWGTLDLSSGSIDLGGIDARGENTSSLDFYSNSNTPSPASHNKELLV